MKKILIGFLFLLGTISHSFAEVGAKAGISVTAGYFESSASEKEGNETSESKSAEGLGAIASLFVEKEINDQVSVGLSFAPKVFETDTSEHVQSDKTTGASATSVTNKVQVDFERLVTLYAKTSPNDLGIYGKVGIMRVDVKTNEDLGTGSKYPDTDMSGVMLAVGYDRDLDNGAFVRVEGSYMNLGGVTVTSDNNSDNSVTTDDVDGFGATISVGRSF
tara:strand:+ start:227 stop:883 length:657 start_codon:yes stop_codon:yes gene_type:complete